MTRMQPSDGWPRVLQRAAPRADVLAGASALSCNQKKELWCQAFVLTCFRGPNKKFFGFPISVMRLLKMRREPGSRPALWPCLF
jgi:hypothetical protein